jgi:hypothetical protein
MSQARWKNLFLELQERAYLGEGAKVKIQARGRGGETGNIYCVEATKD